jgi:RNA 2',3'-cyclic 3'-phosphodiesterase
VAKKDRHEGASGRAKPQADKPRLRVFLAIFPPPEVQVVAAEAIEQLRDADDRVSWVKRENLHFTLRFLGEVGESGSRRAAEAAAEIATDHRSFEAALGPLGSFPDGPRARVLWIGLSRGAEPMVALARSLERALERRGFEREGRPFAAHLTIGRVRDPGRDWSQALRRATLAPAAWHVDRVLLIRSTLSPQGSRYVEIAAAPLPA